MDAAAPTLSIIVPNYNNAAYLSACLESILSQSYDDLEVIIADDASTDDSVVVAHRWVAAYPEKIRLLAHPENQGVSRNRHEAVKEARGRYLQTIDSDDILRHRRKLELEMKLVAFYKQEFGRDICAYSDTVLMNQACANPKPMTPGRPRKEGNILLDLMTRSCFIPTNFIFPKQLYFDVGGYDFSLPIFEDWDLKIRLASRVPFYFSGLEGYGYRRHGRGLSSAVDPYGKKEVLMSIFNKYLALLPGVMQAEAVKHFDAFIEKKY